MKKPAGVIVSAVLLTFLAFTGTISTLTMVALAVMLPHPAASVRQATVIEGILIALMAIPTVIAWCVAIGLFRGKNWARIGAVVLGVLIALSGVFFGALIQLAMQSPLMRAQFAPNHASFVIAEFFWLLLAVFGIWLIVYLNLEPVRQFFRLSAGGAQLPMTAPNAWPAQAPCSVPSQARGGLKAARVVVLVFAGLNLFGSVTLLLMAVMGLPLVYPGLNLQGSAASLAMVVLAAINTAIAIGLWRRFPPAYYTALVLQLLGIVSSLAMLTPSFRARALASSVAITSRLSAPPTPQVANMVHGLQNVILIFNAVLMPVVFVLIIWALLRDLKDIRNAASAAEQV